MTNLGNGQDRYRGLNDGSVGAVGGENDTMNGNDLGVVEVDGIISDFFKYQGKYRPRDQEVKTWGPSVGEVNVEDDKDELLYVLIYQTGCTRWREGLINMLNESQAEHTTRQILAFLHANAFSGIKALNESGYGGSVQIASNPAPKCILCQDWMTIMEGLNFELTSPGTIRDIDYVDVTIGKHSQQKTLEGFCHLMKSMLEMSWTNLRSISTVVTAGEGLFLFNILQMLQAGYGIDPDCRRSIGELMVKYPHLMKCIGFIKSGDKVQWEKPGGETESVCLFNTIHGLFRSAESVESIL